MKQPRKRIMLCLPLFAAALAVLVSGCRRPVGGSAAVMDFSLSGTPAPTATPAPTPTPAPDPVLTFSESADAPLPSLALRLVPGSACAVGGTVSANYPLTEIRVSFTCYRNYGLTYPKTFSVHFRKSDNVTSYDLTGGGTVEEHSLAEAVDFSGLTPGLHTMTLTAKCSASKKAETLAEAQFYVLGEEWEKIKPSDFNGTYDTVRSFFRGKTERFLYPFQWVYDRYVIADPDWEAAYITAIDAYGGRPWLIHIDAEPYYREALGYIEKTSVRVHGTNGDTGVIPLADCILTYNGSYVSRYTSTLKTISHHAFGTATDINANLEPNANKKENNALIDTEIRDLLVYNGILTDEGGTRYYDFTYSGSYRTTSFQMPESVLNYLLYELAFYRAGFQWGHYYVSTSDAMHFSLTDNIKMDHSSRQGLRKVREYSE